MVEFLRRGQLFQYKMKLVILTGGVATGKTTAVHLLKKHGIATVEFEDVIGTALQPNSDAYSKILKHFGGSVLKPDGTLNIRALFDAVNADPSEKQVFDDITRPYLAKSAIYQVLIKWLMRYKVIVIGSSVFFEDIVPSWLFNDIITVSASPETQMQRLVGNMGCTEEVARDRMKAQIPLPFKCAMSTVVLDNNGDVENLDKQIVELIDRWNKQSTPLYKWPDPFLAIPVLVLLILLIDLFI